jgi:hypothetical protein
MSSVIVAMAVLTGAILSANERNQPQAVPATPDNAAAFLGDWTINATGSYGPLTMAVTLKAAEGKVTGEVADANGKHVVTDVSRSGPSVVFGYVFDYQGMAIDALVTLTPNEKTVNATLDFANGAAQFVGTATKK